MAGRHRPRATRHVGTDTVNGWRLKHYSISVDVDEAVDAGEARSGAADAVLATLRDDLPEADVDPALGWTILHQGLEAYWLVVGLWRGDIAYQRLYSAPLASGPSRFERVGPDGPTHCVFEIEVVAHERDAFVRHILDPEGGPQVGAYLADVLHIDVG